MADVIALAAPEGLSSHMPGPVAETGLVWAGVEGYAIWADVPGPRTLAGAALIVAGRLSLVWVGSRRRTTE